MALPRRFFSGVADKLIQNRTNRNAKPPLRVAVIPFWMPRDLDEARGRDTPIRPH
ncbi:hypothetical protein Q2941_07125 [Bradyrhizobium sp. UFLA05-153]